MTIKEICRSGKLVAEVLPVKNYSAVDIRFLTTDGREDETQLDLSQSPLTRAGEAELSELWESLCKEFNAKKDSVTSVVIVATADSKSQLIHEGF